MQILSVNRTGKNLRAKILSIHAVNKTPDHYSENATECPRKKKKKNGFEFKSIQNKNSLIKFNN